MRRNTRVSALDGFARTSLLLWAVLSQLPRLAAQNPAKVSVAITSGETCNEPNPPGRIKYLENKNSRKSVVVKLKVVRTPSQGEGESEFQVLTLLPKERALLGCDREGGGAPVIVDVIWSIEKVTYQ